MYNDYDTLSWDEYNDYDYEDKPKKLDKFDPKFNYRYWVLISDNKNLNNKYCTAGLGSSVIKTHNDITKTKITLDSFKIISPAEDDWVKWDAYPKTPKSKWKNEYTKAVKKILPKLNSIATKEAKSLWDEGYWYLYTSYGELPLGKIVTVIPGKLYAQVCLWIEKGPKAYKDEENMPF